VILNFQFLRPFLSSGGRHVDCQKIAATVKRSIQIKSALSNKIQYRRIPFDALTPPKNLKTKKANVKNKFYTSAVSINFSVIFDFTGDDSIKILVLLPAMPIT
jgi:hypothetical protein